MALQQSQLQPPAQCRAADGGDDRLLHDVEDVHHLGQGGRHRRLAEFGDVGAGAEGAALGSDDNCGGRGVRVRPAERLGQARAHPDAQRVHRRVDDADDGDFVFNGVYDRHVVTHERLLRCVISLENSVPRWVPRPKRMVLSRGNCRAGEKRPEFRL